METGASQKDLERVLKKIRESQLTPVINKGEIYTVVALIGNEANKDLVPSDFEAMDGVKRVQRIQEPFHLASRTVHPELSEIEITPEIKIGSKNQLLIMSGPCSVEGEEQIVRTAKAIKSAGAQVLRGGAYKPRTAPRTFEGLKEQGLDFLVKAKEEVGTPIVTEIMDARDLDLMLKKGVDILQVGARNMQNYTLLDELGKVQKAILLKRGMSASIDEWLLAAERIMHGGNKRVILCERGIRSFDSKYTRNILDLSTIPVIRKLSHLPIVIDPSHGTGKSSFVESMSLAAVAAGADGLMIEVHPKPQEAWSDGPQCLNFEEFTQTMKKIKKLASTL